jgi:hypothetical protein
MSTLDLVRAIAEHLGTGWHAGVDKDATTAGPHLTGPNRQKLAVTTGGTPARGRLIITGDLGDLLIYAPRTLPRAPRITVDQHTPPHRIAREILRRLLPDYEKALTAAWNRHQHSPASPARRVNPTAVIAARLGASRRRGQTDFQFGAAVSGVRGLASVRPGDRDAVFIVSVPHYRTDEFASLLDAFGRLH